MSTLKPGLPPLPESMQHLPIDARGYPVPYFVATVDGVPDHRVVDPIKFRNCFNQGLCWICGKDVHEEFAFVVGPLGAFNAINSEPPMHPTCARYALCACPFLTKPHAHRRIAGLPEGVTEPSGMPVPENPQVMCMWVTHMFRKQKARGGMGVLFNLGRPHAMEWYTQARVANRAEVDSALLLAMSRMLAMTQELAKGEPAQIAARLDALAQLLNTFVPAGGGTAS